MNPYVLGAALARTVAIRCPHCGHKKLVSRVPKHHRVCPRCKRTFPDPLARMKRARG